MPSDAEVGLERREIRVDLLHHRPVRDPVLAPAAGREAADVVAGGEARML